MQNLFDTAECQESANRATAVRSLNHVNARMPARGPTQILLRMPCAGPIQQEGLAQILRQRKASEYRKTCRGRSPCGHSARTREPRRGLIKIKRRRPGARRRSDRPAGQCPKTRRGPQGTPLRCLLAPRCRAGPYAPQRRSARPRRRYLPITQKRPAGGASPAGLSRRT